ncbi:hypothetical protein L6R53_30530 [Myxococcota bacterium]|nr:hypothetical protein [Myxococcota bacterium]
MIPLAPVPWTRTLLALGLLLLPAGRARAQAGTSLLVVAIDDRDGRGLAAPSLRLEPPGSAPVDVAMLDDGSLVGDVPGDAIWMAAHAVPTGASVGLVLREGGSASPRVELAVGSGERSFFAFKRVADGGLSPDPAARPVEGVGAPMAREGDPLVVQAAPVAATGDADAGLGVDQVRVRVVLDDRAATRLAAPRLRVDQAGVEPVALTDDGTLEGDVAGDGIWRAEVVVRRTQYLALSVLEGQGDLAKLTVFLPSTGQAEIALRTTEGEPAVELTAEPQATGGATAPGGASASGDALAGADRLGAVLWTLIALFAVAFAWVRGVAWRAWRDEVRPALGRLERHLDRVEAEADPRPGARSPAAGEDDPR